MAVIEINNLGPINHCRMDLKKFCVLTGPQASGKSTIAKAIFFFRTIKDDCLSLYSREKLSGAENGDLSHSLKKYLRGKFMQMFGSSWSMSMDMCMFYQFGENTYINLSLKKSTYSGIQNYIEFAFSDDILQLLNSLNEKEYEREQVLKMLQDVFQDDFETVYIPAGRSLITLLTSQLNYILSAMDDGQKKSIDYCTQNYMERILRLKPLFSDGMREMYYNKLFTTTIPLKKDIITKLMETIDSILKGKYQYAGGEERLCEIKLQFFRSAGSNLDFKSAVLLCAGESENIFDFGRTGITFVSGGAEPRGGSDGPVPECRKLYACNNA